MLVLYLLLFCASALAYVRPPPTLYDLEDAENIFEEFIKKYNKVYANEQEKQERFNIFKEKIEMVNKLRMSESGQQASFDINNFSDLTKDEFQSRYLGYKPDPITIAPEAINVTMDLPDRWDWHEHNVVTPVKNQEFCGACFAFSTTGTVEGAYAIKHKKLLSFSEQQIVDCDNGSHACGGGTMVSALKYLKSTGGIELESGYPYLGKGSGSCKFDANKVRAQIIGQKAFKLGDDDDAIKQALIQYGPMSIGVWVSFQFEFYFGGILKCPTGTADQINHAVLLVGYGTENGVPYWLIKNSWGSEHYGEKGYVRVQQGNNPCGMNSMGGLVAQVL